MSRKVILEVSDDLAEKIDEEYQNRKKNAVDSLESAGWESQAEKVDSAELADNTAEKTMFILKSEVE